MLLLCSRVLVFLVVTSGAVSGCLLTFCLHLDVTMESGEMEDNFTVAVLALPKFGNFAAPSLQGESTFTDSLVEPFRVLCDHCVTICCAGWVCSWILPVSGLCPRRTCHLLSTLSALGSLASLGHLVPRKESTKVL